jgi:hypothetical protein
MHLASTVEHGRISPEHLAAGLHTTKRELGETLGIPKESLSRETRIKSVSVQMKLRQLVEFLNAVTPAVGSSLMAYAWFRSEPIAGFGGRTPEQIVKDGEGDGLRAHIARRHEGGFA